LNDPVPVLDPYYTAVHPLLVWNGSRGVGLTELRSYHGAEVPILGLWQTVNPCDDDALVGPVICRDSVIDDGYAISSGNCILREYREVGRRTSESTPADFEGAAYGVQLSVHGTICPLERLFTLRA
jgi:hypothetical protein